MLFTAQHNKICFDETRELENGYTAYINRGGHWSAILVSELAGSCDYFELCF